MLPYANDCRKYYICQNGQAIELQCPPNLYWSQLTYRCDRKELSICQPNEPANPINPFSSVITVQYNSFPGDCSRFYMSTVLSCEDNLQWSDQYQSCVAPHLARCNAFPPVSPPYPGTPTWPNGPTAATPPSYDGYTVVSSPLPIDPNAVCGNSLTNAYIPYPGDCQKFIYCGPTASVLNCPANLYFSASTQSCNVSSAGCQYFQ
ncbi:hypothetical protein KR032_007555 [Drosophila birchii]|nr:hypothetical protein KR032_007555 [Drosophila birchii]